MKALAKKSIFVGGAAILALTVFGIMQPADAHSRYWHYEHWARYHNPYGYGYSAPAVYPSAVYPSAYYPSAYYLHTYPGYYRPGLMTRMYGRI
jgi:hypothetical protein